MAVLAAIDMVINHHPTSVSGQASLKRASMTPHPPALDGLQDDFETLHYIIGIFAPLW